MKQIDHFDIFLLEESIWIAHKLTGKNVYDFPFDSFFACRRPWNRPESIDAVARMGAVADYNLTYRELRKEGVSLVNNPEQHTLASELTAWYPKLEDLTPRSLCFDTPPSADLIGQELGWPLFVKGSRQTSRHSAALSIAHSSDEFNRIVDAYQHDPILHWQQIVCREFMRLRPVGGKGISGIPISYEFRTFWWKGTLAGAAPYWQEEKYNWTEKEKTEALNIAQIAVERLAIPFVVVDLAQTEDGRWIVIECNDGQESGYAAVSPFNLWQQIIGLERQET